MKKVSIKINKVDRIASLSLNAINDFDRQNQVTFLNKIAKLFIRKKIYVAYLKSSNSNINLDFKKIDAITVKSHKWYDLLAIRVDNEYLSDMINVATQNDERTEIYYIDEFDWEKFLDQECRIHHNEYKASLVINDNGQTFINFNLELFNLDEITTKIGVILEDIS